MAGFSGTVGRSVGRWIVEGSTNTSLKLLFGGKMIDEPVASCRWSCAQPRFVILSFQGVLLMLVAGLAACSSVDATSDAEREKVQIAVAPASAGITWQSGLDGTRLYGVEVDGRRYVLGWSPAEPPSENGLWALRHCLDNSRIFRGSGGPPRWDAPNLVDAEVHRCVAVAQLPKPAETPMEPASSFDVWLSVDAGVTNLAAGGGNPVWSHGGGGLGAMRGIRKSGVSDLPTARNEVSLCRDSAARTGAVEHFRSAPPGSSSDAFYLETKAVSIEKLVKLFDNCMLSRGFELGIPNSDEGELSWTKPPNNMPP